MFVLDAATPADVVAPIEVTRWRRFRHDRAYVQVHGDHVGYRDLTSGEIRVSRDEDVDLVARVTASLQREADRRRHSSARRSAPVSSS